MLVQYISCISQVFSYLSCLAVFSLLKSNTDKPLSKSQTFVSQLKINEHISLIIFNSLCYRLINLGDFTLFIQVDSI